MSNLRTRILKAIDKERSTSSKFRLEGYEDDYDGFTHQTYSGLAEDVAEALEEDEITNPTDKEIADYVFQML